MTYTVVLVLEASFGVVMSVAFADAADPVTAAMEAFGRLGDDTLELVDCFVLVGRQEDVLGVPVEALRRLL